MIADWNAVATTAPQEPFIDLRAHDGRNAPITYGTRRLDIVDAARMFAAVDLTVADSLITAADQAGPDLAGHPFPHRGHGGPHDGRRHRRLDRGRYFRPTGRR